jgi:hypothetical protein
MDRFSTDQRSQSNTTAAQPAAELDVSFDKVADAAPGHATEEEGSAPSEARRLLEEVQKLGLRLRQNRLRALQTDRRAAAYASRLARHTARLLDHMPDAVPAIKPVPGSGASSLRNYILRHDKLESPDRIRFLVVSSDGRLRLCTVVNAGARLWTDYEVANPPAGMGLGIVFEGLAALIVRLEGAVTRAENETIEHGSAVDNFIADSEAVLFNAGSRLEPVNLPNSQSDESADVESGYLRSHGFERAPAGDVASAGSIGRTGR